MKSYRCDDWSNLARGASVEIRRHGKVFRSGIVETVMPEAGMLWLSADHNGTRALFELAEEFEAWLDPDEPPQRSLRFEHAACGGHGSQPE